jgi:transposase
MNVTLPFLGEEHKHVGVRFPFCRAFCRFPAGKDVMGYMVAGVDIHKKVLMVVVTDASTEDLRLERFRCGTGAVERELLLAWLQKHEVQELVMESTAQYWKPIWMELEPHFGPGKLHLAQAHSNRAPQGRKHDFADAQRLTRRLLAGELILSFVPDAEQRGWRTMTRARVQLVSDRVRLQNQLEALLEEMRIKLSSVVSELLGLSARRILRALADGESDPVRLAELGDFRLKCSQEELADALRGHVAPMHRQLLVLFLERLDLLDHQIHSLERMAAAAMKPYQDAVIRLAGVPGFGAESAQQILAEVGPEARSFDSPDQFASWVGCCPGRSESAENNRSSRCPKGNRFVRRILTQAAQAAVKKKGSFWQRTFRRWLPKLGYPRAMWAIAHKLCRLGKVLHEGVPYVEQGHESSPKAKQQKAQKLIRALRRMGFAVQVSPLTTLPASG